MFSPSNVLFFKKKCKNTKIRLNCLCSGPDFFLIGRFSLLFAKKSRKKGKSCLQPHNMLSMTSVFHLTSQERCTDFSRLQLRITQSPAFLR